MYKEYSPCIILSPYIDKYWEVEGKTEYGMCFNITVDGCTDFIFTLGNAPEAAGDTLVMQPYHSYFVGPMHKNLELTIQADTIHMFGIRFLPCGLFRFMKLPLDALRNIRVSVNDMNTIFEDSFAERLTEKSSFRERINLIENYLIDCFAKSSQSPDAQILLAVQRINRGKGSLSVNTLLDDICLCRRHFERKFKLHTGFSPQKYGRIVKFKHAVGLLRNTSSDNLLSVAIRAGYYDVSHFSREVKLFSGATPGSFLQLPPESNISLLYKE